MAVVVSVVCQVVVLLSRRRKHWFVVCSQTQLLDDYYDDYDDHYEDYYDDYDEYYDDYYGVDFSGGCGCVVDARKML